MQHTANSYEAVTKYDVLKGYLEHFREVSKNNEIPGLLSFFFIQGQAALPYVRIPMGGSNLDPRVSVFWIQDTRTGKSVAYETIEKVMRDAGLTATDCSVGTDAAMVGSFTKDGKDDPPRPQYGVLKGRKGLNFDEGSILLKPSQHSENLVLFLQTALNAAGTGRNRLVKHMKDGTLDYLSYVSLWITTYPPDGIKDYVLDKGIFQRVLLYWRNWTIDMKKDIAYQLADSLYEKADFTMDYQTIVDHFTELDTRLRLRMLSVLGISATEWNEMAENEEDSISEAERKTLAREELAMAARYKMFEIDGSYKPALIDAIDSYYSLVENMDAKKQGICTSFIMGLQNYTNVLAHHMAMIEGVWTIRGDHVDMAREILHDLYKNLLHWLEEEVKVGMSKGDMEAQMKQWKEAMSRCEKIDIENKGPGWVRKKDLFDAYGQINNLSSNASINNRFNVHSSMFRTTKVNARVYVQLKKEGMS